MQIIKKVSAYIVRFSCGKFVEALDEGKVNTYWPLYSQEMNLVRGVLLL